MLIIFHVKDVFHLQMKQNIVESSKTFAGTVFPQDHINRESEASFFSLDSSETHYEPHQKLMYKRMVEETDFFSITLDSLGSKRTRKMFKLAVILSLLIISVQCQRGSYAGNGAIGSAPAAPATAQQPQNRQGQGEAFNNNAQQPQPQSQQAPVGMPNPNAAIIGLPNPNSAPGWGAFPAFQGFPGFNNHPGFFNQFNGFPQQQQFMGGR